MTLPTQNEAFPLTLRYFADGEEHTRGGIIDIVTDALALTQEELSVQTPSGTPAIKSRFGWAISWLSQAGCLERTRRGVYRITKKGLSVLDNEMEPDEFANWLKIEIATTNPWMAGSDKEKGSKKDVAVTDDAEKSAILSPLEQIDALVETLNDELETELLRMILDNDENFFEKLVVNLLEKMGYGKGRVTRTTGDGGIDGIISTDELGFNPIMTQAKRYNGGTVGRPDIQAFAGALGGCTKGVFITTGRFSQGAYDWARSYPHATLVLIDGKKLTQLMVKYNLGVSTERVLEIKRIDSDYFEE